RDAGTEEPALRTIRCPGRSRRIDGVVSESRRDFPQCLFAIEGEVLRPRELREEPNAHGDIYETWRSVRQLSSASEHGGGNRRGAESLGGEGRSVGEVCSAASAAWKIHARRMA